MADGSRDGDLTQILFDRNGVLTGTSGLYVIRADNSLLNRQESCRPLASDAGVAVCNGSYGQVLAASSAHYYSRIYKLSRGFSFVHVCANVRNERFTSNLVHSLAVLLVKSNTPLMRSIYK
jgi:hypothetical protein